MRSFIFFLALTAIFSQPVAAQKSTPSTTQKIVSGTVLLNGKTGPDAKTLLASLKKDWKLRVDSSSIAEKTIVFTGPGAATVMIAPNKPTRMSHIFLVMRGIRISVMDERVKRR